MHDFSTCLNFLYSPPKKRRKSQFHASYFDVVLEQKRSRIRFSIFDLRFFMVFPIARISTRGTHDTPHIGTNFRCQFEVDCAAISLRKPNP